MLSWSLLVNEVSGRSAQPAGIDVHPPAGDPVGGEVEERAALDVDLAPVGERVGDVDLDARAATVAIHGDGLDAVGDGSEVRLPGTDEPRDLLSALDGIDIVEGEHGVRREAPVERLGVVRVDLGVEHLLVERREGTSHLPKAHYLNQRTMEVFRQHGVADAIFDVGCPIEKFGKVRWLTSLGGDGPLDRKLIHSMDAFGGGSLRARYDADSPVTASNYPQLRLEPLLKREAEARAPGAIRFHHEVESWEET